MRRNEGTCCHDLELPSLDLRRTMPGKNSKEERTFKGLDCAVPDPHLRSDYTLTGMRPGVALPTGNGDLGKKFS